jgi:hypothetical protein
MINRKVTTRMVLQRALKLLSGRRAWCQGGNAQLRDGTWTNIRDREAVRFCLNGAVLVCARRLHAPKRTVENTLGLLKDTINKPIWLAFSVENFNDDLRTEKRDVIALLRRAIQASR